MKARLFKVHNEPGRIRDIDGEFIASDAMEIKGGCYFFYNIDQSEAALPKQIMVAVFPIAEFFIIAED